VEDKTGDRIAFKVIERTAAGWTKVEPECFTSWGPNESAGRRTSGRLWTNKAGVITMDVPTAAREDLLRFLPADDVPRLKQ
jgi:hypothetical protein